MPLTDKKRRYAEARLAGQGKKAAAIAAGCPAKTASPAASRYEKDPDVIAHMQRLKDADAGSRAPEAVNPPQGAPEPQQQADNAPNHADSEGESLIGAMLRRGFKDPIDFFEAMVNDIAEDPKLRLRAAEAWASYLHAKPGAGGKKVEKQAAAKQAARGKFGSQPPPLKAVK